MKIFAFNFALDLQLRPGHGHFSFEEAPIQTLVDQLARHSPLFPDQVFFSNGAQTPVETARQLLQDKALAEQRVVVTLLFDNAAGREEFYQELREGFKFKTAAGGVVENEAGEMLLILRNGLWDLPKGKVEKGESIAEGAVREVEEETGVGGLDLGESLGETLHVFEMKGKWRLKTTHWYRMAASGRQNLVPQTEEGIEAVRWWSRDALRNELPRTFPLIEDLIRQSLSVTSSP